jgi:hypothetical protein
MGKLQPNFSFKYTDAPSSAGYRGEKGIVSGPPKKESNTAATTNNSIVDSQNDNRFQFEMAQEHILVSNSLNATIDDASYFTRPRQTSFTWVNGSAIYTVTLPTGALSTGAITIATGIEGNFLVVDLKGAVSNGVVYSGFTLPLPYLDVTVAANSIGLVRNGANIVVTSGGTDYSAYSGWVTVYYIKEP